MKKYPQLTSSVNHYLEYRAIASKTYSPTLFAVPHLSA